MYKSITDIVYDVVTPIIIFKIGNKTFKEKTKRYLLIVLIAYLPLIHNFYHYIITIT